MLDVAQLPDELQEIIRTEYIDGVHDRMIEGAFLRPIRAFC